MTMHRPHRILLLIATLLQCALLSGCSDGGDPDGPRSVLLITVDTLRADHLGTYGYHRDTSPVLDELARQSTVFERALVPVPRTTQSLASILTGKTPAQHGVRLLSQKLPAGVGTLAERFHDEGFDTGALVVIPFFPTAQGFDRGFEDGFEFLWDPDIRDQRAEAVADAALNWLGERGDNPFFLWLHFRDPHAPYYPPAEFRNRFDPDYEGPLDEYFHYFPVDENRNPEAGAITEEDRRSKGALKFGGRKMSEGEIERAVALYDAEIAYTDSQIGRVLDGLEELGRANDTVVVFTADHGESLGEHDFWFDHGEFLYEPGLRVPLVIHVPGEEGHRVDAQVGVIDIAPTLTDLFDLKSLENTQGSSFKDALFGSAIRGRTLFAESGEPLLWKYNPRFKGSTPRDPEDRLRAFCTADGRKLILDPRAPLSLRVEYFDILKDPEELDNLSMNREYTTDIQLPLDALLRVVSREKGISFDELDEEMRRALEENGYLGGSIR